MTEAMNSMTTDKEIIEYLQKRGVSDVTDVMVDQVRVLMVNGFYIDDALDQVAGDRSPEL